MHATCADVEAVRMYNCTLRWANWARFNAGVRCRPQVHAMCAALPSYATCGGGCCRKTHLCKQDVLKAAIPGTSTLWRCTPSQHANHTCHRRNASVLWCLPMHPCNTLIRDLRPLSCSNYKRGHLQAYNSRRRWQEATLHCTRHAGPHLYRCECGLPRSRIDAETRQLVRALALASGRGPLRGRVWLQRRSESALQQPPDHEATAGITLGRWPALWSHHLPLVPQDSRLAGAPCPLHAGMRRSCAAFEQTRTRAHVRMCAGSWSRVVLQLMIEYSVSWSDNDADVRSRVGRVHFTWVNVIVALVASEVPRVRGCVCRLVFAYVLAVVADVSGVPVPAVHFCAVQWLVQRA